MSKVKKRHPLPEGWHDADSLSEILKTSKKALLARLREETWLKTDLKGSTRGGIHNLPHQKYIELGLLKVQTRTYGLKSGFEKIGHSYPVALFHKTTIPTIREIMKTSASKTPTPPKQLARTSLANTEIRIAPTKQNPKSQSSLAERESCISQLKEWGIL